MWFSKRARKPAVHLYCICWNEEQMLGFFFRHYDPIVERYVFFDDGSTDATRSILSQHPRVEVRTLPRQPGDSLILVARDTHNQAWKESRGSADWVISTAVDELLFAPDMVGFLERATRSGVTAIPALGYQMISEEMPPPEANLIEAVRRGCPWKNMNKLSIFDPDRIEEINQGYGRHVAEPTGRVRYPARDQLLLLHYKYLSFEWTFRRHSQMGAQLGPVDKDRGWGIKYDWSRERLQEEWERFQACAVPDVLAPGYDPDREHSALSERWWRHA